MLQHTSTHIADADDAKLWEQYTGIEGSEINLASVQWDSRSQEFDERFVIYVNELLPPNFIRGDAVLRNIWQFGNEKVELHANKVPWLSRLPSRHFRDRLHRFDWLYDMFAMGGVASDRARYLLDSWINVFGHFDSFTWRIEPTADRLWNWLKCSKFLFLGEQLDQEKTRLVALRRQINFLETIVDGSYSALARWRAACVFVTYRLCTQTTESLRWALDQLEKECRLQFFSDGCHVSRSPSLGFLALLDLTVIVDLFQQTNSRIPNFITEFQSKLFSSVNFFRQGDDGLAPFNGGNEIRPELFDVVLRTIDSWPVQKTKLSRAGFYRMERGETLLILDAGSTQPNNFGNLAHAGTLGIEISDGSSRLVTSCGHSFEVRPEVQSNARKTSAHSTLCLGGTDTTVFLQNSVSKLFAPEVVPDIQTKFIEDHGGVWLNAQHAGYHKTFYLTHHRRLFINSDGTQIIGEDSVMRPISGGVKDNRKKIDFTVRFHIHPSTSVTKRSDVIWLEPELGSPWAFKTSNTNVQIEPSLYIARDSVEETEQIVVYGKADPAGLGSEPPNCVRWTFKKHIE